MAYLLALTLLIAPTYAVRFNLYGLSVNVLMLWLILFWVIAFFWLLGSRQLLDFFRSISKNKIILILTTLFFIAGTVSLFVGGFSIDKLGQYIVLFVQPIGTFFIARFIISKRPEAKEILIYSAYIFVALCGIYALIQYFTLIGLPASWWGNSQEPKRAIATFLHPNFYALFITPILAFLMPDVAKRITRREIFELVWAGAWIVGGIGLLMSLSRGGWLGFLAGAGAFIIISANRKYIFGALIALVLVSGVVYAIPNLRYRVLLPFYGEKSSSARLSLWHTGWEMVKDNPILGKGLLGFSNNWYQYNTDTTLDHYPAPHNILLNFWVDTGFLGMISFAGLLLYGFVTGIFHRKNLFALGLAISIIAIVVHGQIDIPYFKNDLALLFWLLFAVGLP